VNTSWFRVREGAATRGVLVLDASRAATDHWPGQRALVVGVGALLPAADRPDVAFLGSAERLSYDTFTRDADRRYAANAGRGRVTGPLLDALGGDRPPLVVVCAVRPPADLADWRDGAAEGVALVRLDPASPGADCPELPFDAAAIAAALTRRPGTVRVRLPGGFPLAWDNLAYRADGTDLVSDAGANPVMRVAFAHTGEAAEVLAERAWDGGASGSLPVEPTAPDPEPTWRTLSGVEQSVVEAWRDGRAARCAACGARHDAGAVACAASGGSVLPTLVREAAGRFVRIRLGVMEATYQPVAGSAAVVGGAVVARDGAGGLAVWQPGPPTGGWVRSTEAWGAFEPAGSADEFLLALPPGKPA